MFLALTLIEEYFLYKILIFKFESVIKMTIFSFKEINASRNILSFSKSIKSLFSTYVHLFNLFTFYFHSTSTKANYCHKNKEMYLGNFNKHDHQVSSIIKHSRFY